MQDKDSEQALLASMGQRRSSQGWLPGGGGLFAGEQILKADCQERPSGDTLFQQRPGG